MRRRSAVQTEAQPGMLPGRRRRRSAIESAFMRLVATAGIIGIGVGLGAILASNKVQGWIIGLVVAIVSVILAGLLWSSRQL
jgi:protein-S-isoprenylcysteine O-methyltransferase Ste14